MVTRFFAAEPSDPFLMSRQAQARQCRPVRACAFGIVRAAGHILNATEPPGGCESNRLRSKTDGFWRYFESVG